MAPRPVLRLGTRPSALARAQADIAARALVEAGVAERVEQVTVETQGDRLSARRPRGRWIAVDGQFTSALESQLRDGTIDLAVHSFKDLPTAADPRLVVGAVLERGDPRDCLITAGGGGLDELPFGARVATSSPRRAAMLGALRPDIVAAPIRGNVDSRVSRVLRGEYDGVLLAAAGLARLGIAISSDAYLPLDVVLPAPAQGALALQLRADDAFLLDAARAIDHAPTRISVEAERALLRRVGGGCLAPLGALGEVAHDTLRLRAAFDDGTGLIRVDASGPAAEPWRVVEAAASELTARPRASA